MIKKRFKSRPPRRKRKRKIFFVVLVLFCFFTLQSIIYFEKNIKDDLLSIARIRVTEMATDALNSAITNEIGHISNVDRLIQWQMDANGKVSSFMIPSAEHLRISSDAVKVVQQTLHHLEEQPESIPLGQAMDSAILASFGPNIPLKYVPAGAVKVDLNIRNENAGINMLLVEVYIKITVEMAIIIPFSTGSQIVETEIPLSYLLVVGDVPAYYFDNKGNPISQHHEGALPPTISLPDIQRNIQHKQETAN